MLLVDHADRDLLGLTQQQFEKAPFYIVLEVLVAAGLCLWGELSLHLLPSTLLRWSDLPEDLYTCGKIASAEWTMVRIGVCLHRWKWIGRLP